MTSTGTSNNSFLQVDWLLDWMPNGFIMKGDVRQSYQSCYNSKCLDLYSNVVSLGKALTLI